MVHKEVETDRIIITPSYRPFCSSNRNIKTFTNHQCNDKFVSSNKKVNPAQQNPIYGINDTYLAKVAPAIYVSKYSNMQFLNEAAQSNKNISSTISTKGKKVIIYPKNISAEINPHFIPTCTTAHKIMGKCEENFSKEEYEIMRKASLLHDIGKVYIPETILNKKGKLTPEEKSIVDQHANLSYETLKSGGVSAPVLELVRKHHTYSNSNKPLVQILQIADIWSALKEKRAYKESFSDKEAMSILYQRAQNGDFEKKYVDALAA